MTATALFRVHFGGQERAAMKKFVSKCLFILPALAVFATLTPLNDAQVQSSITTVSTMPNGLWFYIDGQAFRQTTASVWPAGSKHTLFVEPTQYSGTFDSMFTFNGWTWSGGTLPGNTVVVTADPAINSYQATYSTAFAVNVQFSSCGDTTAGCPSPGTVYVNGTPILHDKTFYVASGGAAVLQAYPADGYVFAGWGPGYTTDAVVGFQKTVTVNSPIYVYPQFQRARTINFASVPSGLTLLQDRTPTTTPGTVQWGVGSTHTVGVVSPQSDITSNLWVFSSWSDGGAANHAYTVSDAIAPDTVTATFVPGALVTLATNPKGLNLSVDGRINWPTYNFTWGVGETHSVSAPAQQTDAQGHIWSFTSWSNGGAASQNVVVPSGSSTAGLRLTATYSPVAHLTVNSPLSGAVLTVNGSACTAPCDIYQPVGSQVDIGASLSVPVSPGSRQDFASWSVSGATATATAANGDLLVTLGQDAVTAAPVYHLMNLLGINANPTTGATFSLQPASTDNFYDSQTSVTVKATILPGYKFRSWTGDLTGQTPIGSVTMASPRAVTALLDSVPYIMSGGVINGAAVTPQAIVAPGSVVSVFGSNLAQTTVVGPTSPMVQTLGGVTATVGQQLLPLYFVSPTQINVQLPEGLTPGQQTITISAQGQPNVQANFQVVADAPGLFPVVTDGVTFGMVMHADGSSVTTASPAQAGETLTLLGTGFGPASPARPAGFPVPATPAYLLQDAATVMIGGISVTPTSAYALPGSVGVDAIQFVVPAGLTSGANSSLAVTIGSATSNTVQLPIQ